MSPDLLNGHTLTEKSDVYSLGMVLIEMITLEIPYSDVNNTSASIQKIRDGILPSALDRILDKAVKQFILTLIDPDPDKRPTVTELINHDFLKVHDKEDNRHIKLNKIRKKKKKKTAESKTENNDDSIDKKMWINKYEKNKMKKVLVKRDYEENSYFEDKDTIKQNMDMQEDDKKKNNSLTNHNNNLQILVDHKDELLQNPITSSHEGGYTQYSKYYSDVYHTNTDINLNTKTASNPEFKEIKDGQINQNQNKIDINKESGKTYSDDSDKKIENKHSQHHENNRNHYQIFDNHYNVHLKFLINQDGKLHEIQFTYNLIRDNIPDLMEEIQNEFNFSVDHLNHIYETLKKISIYSKFYKNSDILHDNSF